MSTSARVSGSRYSWAAAEQLVAPGDAGLDEVDEAGAGLDRHLEVRGGRERIVVGHRLRRGVGADHPDPSGVGGRGRAAHRGQDHLDDRDVVALPGVAEHRRAGRVAGDHQRLHPLTDQVVEALEGVLADLADRLGAVGLAGGVADVQQRLVRQLVDHRAGDGESAEARVEDADRQRVASTMHLSATMAPCSWTAEGRPTAAAAATHRSRSRGPTAGARPRAGPRARVARPLVDGCRFVGAGREVLPAAVADHERDVGAAPPALTAFVGLGRARRAGWRRSRCRRRCPRAGAAGAARRSGVTRGPTEKRAVDAARPVVQLGARSSFVEVAQAVDELAVAGLGGDDPAPPAPCGRGGSARRPSGCRWCRARRRSG